MPPPPPNPSSDPFLSAPFLGIPTRTLTSDALEYQLYALSPSLTSAESRLAALKKIHQSCLEQRKEWCEGYIFHRGAEPNFHLPGSESTEEEAQGENGPASTEPPPKDYPAITGHLEYGDAIDDEWFALSLLLRLTQLHPTLWLSATDTSDGVFLLVEAAHYLPRWLTPETALNRVWINQGRLYIIPGKRGEKLTLPAALEFLSALQDPGSLLHHKEIEREALQRTKGYPEKKREMEHWSTVRIPRSVAGVLFGDGGERKGCEEAIAAAVDAFYIRDPVSLKCLAPAPPKRRVFPSKDWVRVSVRFSKVLYAQLRGQQWHPPAAAGFPNLPDTSGVPGATVVLNSETREWDIGIKITAGFEMLMAKENRRLFPSQGLQRVIQRVEKIVGDEGFKSGEALPKDDVLVKRPIRNDDDSWLDIDFVEFEKSLNNNSNNEGEKAASTAGADGVYNDADQQRKMQLLVERFEKFLNDDKAGLDGAELGSGSSDDDDDDDDDDVDGSEVSFDEQEFTKLMREMMGMPPDVGGDENEDGGKVEEVDEEEEIRKMQDAIGEELRAAGIIGGGDGGKDPSSTATDKKGKGKARITDVTAKDDDEEEEESDIDEREEVEVDFELVKNMLESFKGQGGLAGPAGTLLAEMGIHLPRDEGERVEAAGSSQDAEKKK